jgi:hypothetical protein
MRRRSVLKLAGLIGLYPFQILANDEVQPPGQQMSLLTAPIELSGKWDGSPQDAVALVLSRAREACLAGWKLRSDRQPDKIRVDNHSEGSPAIWLHQDPKTLAWIIVDVGPRDWSKLAYQFGHELGHVVCNSWDLQAKPQNPSQWVEEAVVEAFSLRGLARLATSWEKNPPFAHDENFANSLREYRAQIIEKYAQRTDRAPGADIDMWFRAYRSVLETNATMDRGPAVIAILTLLRSDPACVEDLGALNRWPSRSGVPVEEYLTLWERSCKEIGSSARLPKMMRNLFQPV